MIDFLIALSGAIVGGFFTLFGALFAAYLAAKKEEENEKKYEYKVLNSLKNELSSLRTRALETLLIDDQTLTMSKVSQNYLSIYENHTEVIASLSDENLSQVIIFTYIQAKGCIDTIKTQEENIKAILNVMGKLSGSKEEVENFLKHNPLVSIPYDYEEVVKNSIKTSLNQIEKTIELINNYLKQ